MPDQIEFSGPWHAQVSSNCIQDTEISEGARLLYADLCVYRNRETHKAFPGMARLGKDLGVSRRTVARRIQELEERGWIDIEQRYDKQLKVFKSNRYTVHSIRVERPEGDSTDASAAPTDMDGSTPIDTDGSTPTDMGVTITSPSEHPHLNIPNEDSAPDGARAPDEDEAPQNLEEAEVLLEHDLAKMRRAQQERDTEKQFKQWQDEHSDIGTKFENAKPQSQESDSESGNGSASNFNRIKAGVVWASEGVKADDKAKNKLIFSNGKKRKEIMRVTKALDEYGIDPDGIYAFVRDWWPTFWKSKDGRRPKPCDVLDHWIEFERWRDGELPIQHTGASNNGTQANPWDEYQRRKEAGEPIFQLGGEQ